MMSFSGFSDGGIALGLGLEKIQTPAGPVVGHSGGGFGSMTLLFHEPATETSFFVGTNLGAIFESEPGNIFYHDLLYDLVAIIKS
jgi:hypothetical protein